MTQPTKLNHVTCAFGVKGNWAAGYHTGIDYRAAVGTKIHATRRGRVVKKGKDDAYGNYIVIQSWHRFRPIQHWYCHLKHVPSRPIGNKVLAGHVVGYSGNTGNSTAPHLHYEERVKPFGYHDHIKPVLPKWRPRNPIVYRRILKRLGISKKK